MLRSALNDLNDVRELIPEFYFFLEMFINENNFDLGELEGHKIDNVDLPPWAHNSPVEYVYMLRKALECDFVSQHLHEWIDLVFGYKQKGKAAELADNVYSPYLYEDIWTPERLNNPAICGEIEAAKSFLGQVPHQLFTSPHPLRAIFVEDQSSSEQSAENSDGQNIAGQKNHPSTPDIIATKKFLSADKVYVSSRKTRRFSSLTFASFDKNRSENEKAISNFKPPGSSTNIYKFDIKVSDIINVAIKETRPGTFTFTTFIKNPTNRNGMLVASIPVINWLVASTFSSIDFSAIMGENIVGCLSDSMFLVQSEKVYLYESTNSVMTEFCNDVQSFANDYPYFCIIDSNSVLSVYRADKIGSTVCQTQFNRDVARCSAISTTFRVVVVCSRDGGVAVHSLDNGFPTRIFELGQISPIAVQVSPAWGFIVNHFTRTYGGKIIHMISVHTINGIFVREKILPFNLDRFCLFKNPDGFDFIALVSDDGSVYVCELFTMEIGSVLVKLNSKIIHMGYYYLSNCIVLATNKGRVVCQIIDFSTLNDNIR